ncbi:hypothetical protein LguiA_029833 [Lonicera macranthoides]
MTNGLLTTPNSYLHNAILHMYATCGASCSASKVFDEIALPHKDTVDWTTLMGWYTSTGMAGKSLLLFNYMQKHCVLPDNWVKVFDDMKEKTVVSWTVLLEGVVKWAGLENGRWLHLYILKMTEKEMDIMEGTSLIDMYAKCGRINIAFHIFKKLTSKTVVAWNAMLGGLEMHSWGEIIRRLRLAGYVPYTDSQIFSGFGKDNEDEQEEKEQAFFFHNEKLAYTKGIL